jgi:chromate reductase, NAD(P)H dehydrogenase (quinone)
MYTIISGTNRVGSNTLKVAKQMQLFFAEKGIEANVISLEGVDTLNRNAAFLEMEEKFLKPTQKFIIITPEYNGGIPGVFKALVDNSDLKNVWWNKSAMLIGVSTGRQGNARGLDFLTNIFHYIKMHVLPNKIPLSVVNSLLDAEGIFTDQNTIAALKQQVDEFIEF